MARLIGVDVPGSPPPSTTQLGTPGNIDNTAFATLNASAQLGQQALQYEEQSMAQRQQLVQQSLPAIQSANQANAQAGITEAQARAVQQPGNGVLGAVIAGLGTYYSVKQQEQAAAAKLQETQFEQGLKTAQFQQQQYEYQQTRTDKQAQAAMTAAQAASYAQAYQDIQDLGLEYTNSNYAKLRDSSVSDYRQRLIEVIRRYPALSPEQIKSLIGDGYNVAQQYISTTNTAQQKYVQDVDVKQREILSSKLQLQINGSLGRLSSSGVYSNPNDILESVDANIRQFLTDNKLDALSSATVLSDALKTVLGKLDQRNMAYGVIEQRLSAVQQYYPEMARINSEVEQGLKSPDQRNAELAQLRLKLGVPDSFSDIDPFAAQKLYESHLGTEENIRKLIEAGQIRQAQAQQLSLQSIGYLAYTMINTPSYVEQLKANPVAYAQPGVKAAIDIAERWRQDNNKFNELKLARNRAVADLTQAQRSDITWFINAANRGNDPNINAILEQMRIGVPQSTQGLTPEQTAQVQQAMLRHQQMLQQQVQEYDVQLGQLNVQYAPYGLMGTPQEIQQRMATYRATYDAEQQKLQAVQQQQPQSFGVQSPFKSGQSSGGISVQSVTSRPVTLANSLYKITITSNIGVQGNGGINYKTGATTIIPFKAGQTNVSFTSPYGEPGHRGHTHAGQDVAAPQGTPVVFYMGGRVTHAGTYDGYGNTVDIIGDDGMLHRFAHGMAGGIKVKEGDRVQPGQVIMLTGNTAGGGAPVGYHLHWEVRNPQQPFGYNGTLNPMTYLSSLPIKASNMPKPASDSIGWSLVNDVTPGNNYISPRVPANALPIGGGAYLLNGKVGYIKQPDVQPQPANFNVGNPLRSTGLSHTNRNIKNDPNASYGYSALERLGTPVKSTLAKVATNLGIPAVWLADIIANETSWTDFSVNKEGYGGLIGFGNDASKDMGVSQSWLVRQPLTTQLQYVARYLTLPYHKGALQNLETVAATIFGGVGLLRKLQQNRAAALRVSDGYVTFGQYLQRLGRDAGRKYHTARRDNLAMPLHDQFHDGCKFCHAIAESNSPFIVHQADVPN